MYKVLHIMPAADIGGISAVILNYYRFMDRQKIHFDVAITSRNEGQDALLLRELGARIYHIPPKSRNYAEFKATLVKILTEGRYDCIHVHENTTSYVALRIAKKMGIRNRIAHSHTSAPDSSVIFALKRLSGCILNAHYATHLIGCGKLAGDRVFGKWNMKRRNAVVLPNAIDTELYGFNARTRGQIRDELCLNGKYVIGMVGRLSREKNHMYALHLMQKIHATAPEAVLLLVGNGEQESTIQQAIAQGQMQEYVKLLGRRNDMHRLYQGFDAMLMPSIHEGFPVAAVEAMASGLTVLLSDTITRELDYGLARYLKLGDDDAWLQALQNLKSNEDRTAQGAVVKAYGLDIRDSAKQLETLYLKNL